jgi:SAM-dependent methyltransferase
MGQLSDIQRYIELIRDIPLDEKRPEFEELLELMRHVKPIDGNTRLLEAGIGSGWFQILCSISGIPCVGVEIYPELVKFAHENARKHGVELNLMIGSIEDVDIGEEQYDVIFATSVFEHVLDWKQGVERIYRALRPGGLFYFSSTNKFSFVSGEYHFPLYGWLPDRARFALRKHMQGDDIMQSGIDFHQFRYGQLSREFTRIGFSNVQTFFDVVDESRYEGSTLKRTIFRLVRSSRVIRTVMNTFNTATVLYATK